MFSSNCHGPAVPQSVRSYGINYDGVCILKKHATYRDFLRQANAQEAGYFAFAAIRNPMDKQVSLYFKYKNDHNNFSLDRDPRTFANDNVFVRWLMQRQFRYVYEQGASFSDFLRRYYRMPYDDWSSLDHRRMSFIIRFENLADDFAEVLRRLGISPQRPLPMANKTNSRENDFWSYYPRELRDHARWVFGPYFRRWGYSFPSDWDQDTPFGSELAFAVSNVPRQIYWRLLR